ncbi:hypothetical protein L1049_024996 [Liquidambar formosana]|uniref:Wall-associated receptor kinase domain-containing protein n=1 Tax=Liquidambar formosana TaxID=63359 RepID=A0AAP0RVL0_LIQFO
MSICNGNERNDGGCYGVNCCQTTIPPPLKFFNVSFGTFNSKTDGGECKYAFLAEDSSYTSPTFVVRAMEYGYPLSLPAVLDWVIDTKTCDVSDYSSISTCGPNAYCSNLTSITPQCYCAPGYQGNPFLQQGCPDKCMDSIDDPNSCWVRCFSSSMGDRRCYILENPRKRSRVKVVILASNKIWVSE